MTAQNDKKEIRLRLLTQYTKAIQFEILKRSDEISQVEAIKPSLQWQLAPKHLAIADNRYQVSLEAKISSEIALAQGIVSAQGSDTGETQENKETLWTLMIEYAGLFQLDTAVSDPSILEEALLVDCALLLFPFLRQQVAAITMDSGYIPVRLDPIDLRGLYVQYKQKMIENAPS